VPVRSLGQPFASRGYPIVYFAWAFTRKVESPPMLPKGMAAQFDVHRASFIKLAQSRAHR